MLATIVQLPPLATAVPTTVAPSKSVTVVPLSAVPVKVGAVTLVMLSVFDMPLSLAAVRSGTDAPPEPWYQLSRSMPRKAH